MSGKKLFFVFLRDLIYLLCIPDLQKVFSSHTLSITILLTREHFVRALNWVTQIISSSDGRFLFRPRGQLL